MELKGIAKEYDLEGGERVTALRHVDLHSEHGCPFTGVRKGESKIVTKPRRSLVLKHTNLKVL